MLIFAFWLNSRVSDYLRKPQKPKWRISDLNRRPLTCEASALPTELIPHSKFNYTLELKFCELKREICFVLLSFSYQVRWPFFNNKRISPMKKIKGKSVIKIKAT